MSTDRIEKTVFLRAPRSRVWRAIVTPEEFGAWFGVNLENAWVYYALVAAVGLAVAGRMNPLLAAILWFFTRAGDLGWLWCWIATTIFMLM